MTNCGPCSHHPGIPKVLYFKSICGIRRPFLLPCDVDHYHNKKNSVFFAQVIQKADNITMLSACCMTCENNIKFFLL